MSLGLGWFAGLAIIGVVLVFAGAVLGTPLFERISEWSKPESKRRRRMRRHRRRS